MTYRHDIDGLRAIAVLAVLLFHLGFERFAGGFVGVDMFFVISGFLITSILEARHAQNTFSYRQFYLSRVRRLLPALFVTIAVTFLASAWIMVPDDFQRFARSAIAAVLSVSNFIFFVESGYWDTASDLKPLLHTWSLGVEEQFYLFWPIFLSIVFGPLRRFAGQIFLLVTVGGVIASVLATQNAPAAAFFWSPFRVFEFSIGAVIIYAARWQVIGRCLQSTAFSSVCLSLGFALCGYAILEFDGNTEFPGIMALIPCLGTALLILAGTDPQQPLVRATLALPIARWLGRVSYSMYLVHWPIIALYRYKTGHDLAIGEQAMLACVTLIATIILYYGVEQKLRKPVSSTASGGLSNRTVVSGVAAVAVGLSAVSLSAYHSQGWLWRLPSVQLTPDDIDAGRRARFTHLKTSCRIDWIESDRCAPDRPLQVLLFGNSHEPDALNFFRAGYGEMPDLNLIYFGTVNQCGSLEQTPTGWRAEKEGCNSRAAMLSNSEFVRSLDMIVYAAKSPFGHNKQNILTVLTELKLQNPDLEIATMGGYITTEVECARLINEGRGSETCKQVENVRDFALHENEMAQPLYQPIMALSDYFIDRVDLLCVDQRLETCLTETPGGVPLMYDGHHLSLEFAEYSGRLFAQQNPHFFSSLRHED